VNQNLIQIPWEKRYTTRKNRNHVVDCCITS